VSTPYTRKQLADLAGIGVEAVRFYEKLGLLPEPSRSAAGYRLYSEDDVSRVRYVKRAQELGFSLSEIKDLITLTSSPASSRAELRTRAREKIAAIRAKISDLKKMDAILTQLVQSCDGRGKIAGCPIFEFMQPRKEKKS
jgi:MerR family transcriptional regulator, copper efflux regulator